MEKIVYFIKKTVAKKCKKCYYDYPTMKELSKSDLGTPVIKIKRQFFGKSKVKYFERRV